MAYRILVVKAEHDFVTTLASQLGGYGESFAVSSVVGRKEAINELKNGVFDRIVTALKIPRISDGYLFLSHIGKTLAYQKVIVVVDDKSDEVERSLHNLGIKQMFSAANVKGVLQSLLEDAGLGQRQSMVAARVGEGGDLSIDNIKTALSLVMGPVGNMIFNDIASRVGDSGDLQQLVSLIANEIGEEKKISLFQQHLRT
jgi:CheY-like chemotaxis protein